jgi:acyl transferase domain-containing protein/NADPH:quinone reductase-like Zn-dependent oxidoreductase/thioesterase domain-containing protein/NAD(P)-dependent dehydrogenase (short-subunit alcohol dehydrogenase family)/acyl carrier protein
MSGTEVAVVGMAARFPGARNVQEFWRNLQNGVEATKFFTAEELRAAGESPERLADPAYVRAQASIDGVDQFDAGFFGFSPQDAAVMDPQHRILLEVAWEALESAGHHSESFAGNIGVFAACGMNSYMMYNLLGNRRIMQTVGEWLVRHTGNDMNFLATRLSYEMNLKGPSMNVQTACSSALVAIHQASQSLLAGECDMALAGACTLHAFGRRGYLYRPGEILSPDGRCRPFDERASGTIFGSGAGMVVLRRLSDALADGDPVCAVLLGSAINNDGSMKAGYLAPGVEGQSKCITEALAASGVHPETIAYIEAHGTGTPVGDPIEAAALTVAYRRHTRKKGFCALGSVKSNIGHLGEAAGAAGFIKAVLALENRRIPPTLHFESPNPRLELESSPFFVNSQLREWPDANSPRRAGVTALGAGGTNCHVILEEAPRRGPSGDSRPYQLLTLSAATPAALEAAAANLAAHLKGHPDINLADTAFTLSTGRKAFPFRRAVVCANREEAIAALEGKTSATPRQASDAGVAFLFPGQGSQYRGMGGELYDREPVFRRHVDECAAILSPELGLDLRAAMFGAEGDLTATALAQPALFTIEYALARLWMNWGVKPQAMLGHSIGEYAAAHLAGVFSLEDALALVAARGSLMQQTPAGAMLAVNLPVAEVERHMNGHAASGRLSLAAMNAPELSVVAGSHETIGELESSLAGEGAAYRRLHTSHAFHSAMMDPILDAFRDRVRQTTLRAPVLPFVSNVTGDWIRAEEATNPEYWVQHLRKPVRFAEGISTLLKNPNQVLLETGPGQTLSMLVREQPVKPVVVVSSLRRANEEASDAAFLLKTCGQLWSAGVPVDWGAFWKREQRHRLALPAYPFQRQSYWIEPDKPEVIDAAVPEPRPLRKQQDIANCFYRTCWKSTPPPPPSSEIKHAWLVFEDETGLAEALTERLAQAPPTPLRLHIVRPGDIDSLAWMPVERTAPQEGEVEIEVRATALNFADVLKAAEVSPEAPFGMECAGVVSALGPGVGEWGIGDEVVAIGPDSHATRVIRDARWIARKPASLSFEEAVTLPAAYMTAWYALHHVGGLKRGEKILIHAAAGGVGLAALEIAQAIGAEVFATAGSEEKRAHLESLGVRRVFSSRTLDFADQIDCPVDVVLNSLTGDFIPKSLGLLGRGGRFLEIGKKEILTPDQVPAGIVYAAVDLVRMLRDDPAAYGALLAEVVDKVRQGEWKPLPRRVFPIVETRAAFEYMLQSKHTGKVVLSVQEPPRQIFSIRAGDKFRRHGEREFTIRPSCEADYQTLLESLGETASQIGAVAHLWNVTRNASSGTWEKQLDPGFFSLTSIAKALGRLELARPLDFCVISNGLQDVAGETALDPAKALLLGPCRVIPREFENIRCRSIDVEAAARGSWQHRRLASQLAAEMESQSCDRTLAYRGSQRWVEAYEPALPAPNPIGGPGAGLRERGVYLITGGLGGIGLELAEHLARTVHARLILVGRTLPDARKLERLQRCEALGGQVLIARADTADLRQMRQAVTEAHSVFGEIHGVFHLAGVLDDGLIQLKSAGAATAVLRPKVQGALVLEEIFEGAPLDFVVLFSSVSSVLGLEGQVDYTAANAFLDAFAQHLAKRSSARVVSIGWSAWKEVGMAAAAAGEKTFRHMLSPSRDWILGEHAINGAGAILPGTGYLEIVRSAVSEAGDGAAPIEIAGVVFHAPFRVGLDESKELVLTLKADASFTIRSNADSFLVHVTGRAARIDTPAPARADVAAIRERCGLRNEVLNGHLRQSFMNFGPRWANVSSIHYGREEALISLALPAEFASDLERWPLHPALLDMATGGAQPLIPGFDAERDFYVPFSYGRLRLWQALPPRLLSHVRLKGPATFYVTLMDEDGNILCQISDFVMRRFDHRGFGQSLGQPDADAPTPADSFDTGMLPKEGLAALVRILEFDTPPRIFVTPVDLNQWIARTDAAARPKAARTAASSSSSGGGIEQRLEDMWSHILGVGKIAPDDDFFQLGGHSLLLVRLVNRIEKEFGTAIPLSYLFQSATIARIAAYLRDTSAKQLQFFVAFNEHGSGPAFFCVHSMGGDTHYRRLAQLLGPEQRFYGIQIPPELRTLEFTSSVEGMASRYVNELLAFQPQGPYLLGGRSAGACIALEMAQQLRARGHEIGLLVSIDGAPLTVLDSNRRRSPRYFWKVLRNFPRWVADDLAPGFSTHRLFQRAKLRLARITSPERGTEKERVRIYLGDAQFSSRAVELMESFYGAVMRYVPKPYAGPVLLFQATEPLYDLNEVDEAWKRIAPQLEIVRVRGTHASLVNEPRVLPVAEHLRNRLRAVSLQEGIHAGRRLGE